MPILVACPACSQQLRVTDNLIGKKVRCSACKEIFDANAPAPPDSERAGESSESSQANDLPLEQISESDQAGNGLGIKLSLDDDEPPVKRGSSKAVQKPDEPNGEDSQTEPRQTEPRPQGSGTDRSERRPKLSRFSDDLRDCPKCGAQVHRDLETCNRCGARLGTPRRDEEDEEEAPSRRSRRSRRDEEDDEDSPRRERRPVRRDCEPHRAGLVLTLGITSLVLVGVCWPLSPISAIMGVITWVMGSGDLRKMNAGQMDPEGRGSTQAGYVCGIISACLGLLFTIGCAAYIGLVAMVASNAGPGMGPQPAPKVAPAPGRKF
jgi:predicted Zn finger-like uncharacterized protein